MWVSFLQVIQVTGLLVVKQQDFQTAVTRVYRRYGYYLLHHKTPRCVMTLFTVFEAAEL